MKYQDITELIIGCAFKVYNVLGYGYLESVYENALLIELEKAGLFAEKQKLIEVFYDGHKVGYFRADIVVNEKIIVELKSAHDIITEFEVQLVNYLTATGIPVGLLLNFGRKGVQVKRKVKSLDDSE